VTPLSFTPLSKIATMPSILHFTMEALSLVLTPSALVTSTSTSLPIIQPIITIVQKHQLVKAALVIVAPFQQGIPVPPTIQAVHVTELVVASFVKQLALAIINECLYTYIHMQNKFFRFLIPLTIFLTPLLFWTLTPNFFATPKQLFLLVVVFLLLVSYGIAIIQRKNLTLPRSILTFPLLGMLLAIILNLIFISEGRGEALADKGALLIILPILSLLILLVTPKIHLVKAVTVAIIGSSLTLAIHTLLQLTYLHTATFLPSYMQTRGFTPTGSLLTTLILILAGGLTTIFALKQTSTHLRPLYLVITIINTIASVAIISLILPGSPMALNLMPYLANWSITLDALKSTRSLLIGVGIPNFAVLFTTVKPLSLNLGSLWNILPQTGTSELLTILATTGLLGFLSLMALIYSGLKLVQHKDNPLTPTFIIIVLALVLTPNSLPLYLLFFTILPLLDEERDFTLHLTPRISLILSSIIIVFTLTLGAYSLRPYLGDYYFRKALLAFTQNDGKTAYDAHRQAIAWYPGSTLYHLSFAETNLNLALALSQKKELTEEERTTISTLIQQAISESKIAIQLHPNYSLAWSTLAKIYRNLINVAKGSDQFAIDYYARAIALDPGNPILRVDYGGLFYQLGQSTDKEADKTNYFNRAASEFQTATQLRPTYANAYYNLAKLLETLKDYPNSYLAMQKVVANLDSSSPDYTSALSELETLKTKLPKTSPTTSPVEPPSAGGSLSAPSPLPSPLPGGPLDLPTPTPTPTP